jgi:hypothetical protein
MEPVKNSGTLSEISCPRLLAHLHRTRFDGTLRVSRGALLKLLYFQGGEIAMASSNDQGDHLAPILIRAGKLKPEQMALARKSTKAGTSLARVLVQMGFLTSGELFAGARQQLRQIVGSILGMTEASYEIQGGFFPREITSLNVDTREMLLDLIRDLSDRSFVLLEVGAPDTVYVPAKDSANGSDGPRLPRAWKDHAERFSSPLAIHEFGQMSSLDDFSASKVVYGLSLFGCLAPHRQEESGTESPTTGTDSEAASLPEPVAPAELAVEEAPDSSSEEPSPDLTQGAESLPAESEVEPIPTFRERFHSVKPLEVPPRPMPEPPVPTFPDSAPALEESTHAPEETPASLAGIENVSSGGPIRLEFKGTFAEKLPPVKPSRPWAMASILGGIVLLALTSYWFIFLRTPGASGNETASAPAVQEAPSVEPASRDSAASGDVEADHPGVATGAAAGETSETDHSAPASSPPPEVSTIPEEASGQVAPPSKEPPVQPSPAGSAGIPVGFHAARSRLDAGEYASAAQSWAGAFGAEASRSFTIQIAIACQPETLKKAARRTPNSDQFFVLPFALGGRPCYRLCWGVYESLDSAQSARSSVPSFFLDEGGQPVVVSFQKALAAGGR